ncbi:MAG TPA: SlyX protein [Planctomycetaceae bacterium]|nr:SlyX protein [Planctomycetaceae bacterium]
MNLDERVERLEMELAHQQRVTDQLNEAVSIQSLDVLRLQRVNEQLIKQIEELRLGNNGPEEVIDLEDEKPPHY